VSDPLLDAPLPDASLPDGPLTGPLLDVRDLSVSFTGRAGKVTAVDGVSLSVPVGGRVGVVGESGSGKSVTMLSILRLLRPPGRIDGGHIQFAGNDLRKYSNRAMARLRGADIALVFQDPMTSWNPVQRVGTQIEEAILLHNALPRREVRARAIDLLRQVGIPAPEQRINAYPHQFSGGMRQRGMIAMALANGPRLLIADEPTTALDVTVQDQILRLLRRMNDERGTAILLVTHNIAVVASLCEEVIVMYAGRVVERGPTRMVFRNPAHPYTAGLLRSIPRIDQKRGGRLSGIPGQPLEPGQLTSGCRFRTRCDRAQRRCEEDEPGLETMAEGHHARCWFPVDAPTAEQRP
jgi:oligopeptide/dipeptide ABC transporter ATP-binding protein